MGIFMFKGIECEFSEKAEKIVESDDAKTHLLETFFEYQPIDSIKWVSQKDLLDARKTNTTFPMYQIGNGVDELLLWPVLLGSDLSLGVESATERPDLQEALANGTLINRESFMN